MTTCDVLVVGGGPAGSTCASELVRRGRHVIVLDKASFPRDKVCAGWITPAVVRALELDLNDYQRGPAARTLQPFTGFRAGGLTGEPRLVDFGRVISYGIRRCEFDDYLVRRSGAEIAAGAPLASLRRDGATWIANDRIRASVVVGAGGHFCPVARHLNDRDRQDEVVAAQEIEVRLDARFAEQYPVRPEAPDLFFWPDLLGYGWCVRKGAFLNIGAGRLRPTSFPAIVEPFKRMLRSRGLVPEDAPAWKGHAYLLNRTARRRVTGDGMLLVGDAAGLALAPSGEGILSAVESGLIAAQAIAGAWREGTMPDFPRYAGQLAQRFGPRGKPLTFPAWAGRLAGRVILGSAALTRRVLIEDGFLHLRRPEFGAEPWLGSDRGQTRV